MGYPVTYFDIGCEDAPRNRRFYQEAFGWKLVDRGLSAMAEPAEGKGISGAITSLGHEPHQYVMVYLEVDDIPAVLAKIEEYGGSVVMAETPIPSGGSFAWFKDPGGNMLGLHKKNKD